MHPSLEDESRFTKVLDLTVPWAHSYADMRPGKTDIERRENFRAAALQQLQPPPFKPSWWAFRLTVHKSGRPMDVDNVAKTIIDSFCIRQIQKDKSTFLDAGLYPDDTFDHVRSLQVLGLPNALSDSTRIEIFAHIPCDTASCA